MAHECIYFECVVSGNFYFQNHLNFIFISFISLSLFLRVKIKMFPDLGKFHSQLRRSQSYSCNNSTHEKYHSQFQYEALFYIIKNIAFISFPL